MVGLTNSPDGAISGPGGSRGDGADLLGIKEIEGGARGADLVESDGSSGVKTSNAEGEGGRDDETVTRGGVLDVGDISFVGSSSLVVDGTGGGIEAVDTQVVGGVDRGGSGEVGEELSVSSVGTSDSNVLIVGRDIEAVGLRG